VDYLYLFIGIILILTSLALSLGSIISGLFIMEKLTERFSNGTSLLITIFSVIVLLAAIWTALTFSLNHLPTPNFIKGNNNDVIMTVPIIVN